MSRTYTQCPKCGHHWFNDPAPERTPLTHGEWMFRCRVCEHRWSTKPRPTKEDSDE